MRIEHPLVDYLPDPIGLDSARPRFSYTVIAERPEERQVAYRIRVASSADRLTAGRADVWDSGPVEDDRPFAIEYGGPDLAPRRRFHWSVEIRDQDGRWSGPSPAARWETGMQREPWGAEWVGAPDTIPQTSAPRFATEFSVPSVSALASARIRVAGLGLFAASLNGEPLTDDLFEAGESDFSQTVYYVTYDVLDRLIDGPNALGVVVGNGQYVNFEVNPVMRTRTGEPSAHHRYQKDDAGYVRPGLSGEKRMLVRIELTDEDGRVRVLEPAASEWAVSGGPITFNDWYGGEDFDATLDEVGWDTPGSDHRDWQRGTPVEAPLGRLRGRDFRAATVVETFPAASVTRLANGGLLVDMGRNVAGFPEIEFRRTGPADRGTTVRILPAEVLRDDGSGVDQSSCTQSASEHFDCAIALSYTMAGTGEERWRPRFCYQGFQYLEVVGYDGDLDDVSFRCCVVRVANDRAGSFTSSHADLDTIVALTDRSIESNMMFSFTDCPQIEKLGWLETSHLMLPSIAAGWDIRSWIPKIVRDIVDSQTTRADHAAGDPERAGYVPAIAPEYHRIVGLHRDPNWGGACILTPWEYYRFYGDASVLRTAYSTMRAYLAHLAENTRDGLLDGYAQMGDWGQIAETTPTRLVENAAYVRLLRAAAAVADLLGDGENARADARRAQIVADGIHADPALFRADGSVYGNGSQTSYGCVLFSGIVPEERRAEVLANLVAAVEVRGDHLSSGEVGLKQVFASLARGGRSDVVLRMVLNGSAPSYKVFVDAGLSTLPEYWNYEELWNGMVRSRNHAMMGHVREWVSEYILGVRSEAIGFRSLLVAPALTRDVPSAAGRIPTSYGPVAVDYRHEAGRYAITVDLPAGTTALVALPCDEGALAAGWDGYAHPATRWEPISGAGPHRFEIGSSR